jgi:hypothetical protein
LASSQWEVHTGLVVFDKYLGPRLVCRDGVHNSAPAMEIRFGGPPAMVVMAGIELFQLTMIPAQMLFSKHLIIRLCARLIGTEFSFFDLFA